MLIRLTSSLFFTLSQSATRPAPTLHTIQSLLNQYSQQLAQSKVMESMVPRIFTEQSLTALSANQRFSGGTNHIQSLEKTFSEPIWDLLDRGGKRWRPVLCMLIAQLLGHPRAAVLDIAALCEIIHNGTLMVDDIEDSSTVRRNKPCVHLLYGVDIAVNAGNFMYFAPMLSLLKSGKYSSQSQVKLSRIYFEEMVQLHVGQGWDILWHNIDSLQGNYPTENQYLQMTAHKTGVLARLSSRMVCASLGATEAQTQSLIRFVENMGVAFQIQDDLLNLEGEEFKKTKGYSGEDIHEGKITLMVIHHLRTATHPTDLLAILNKKTQDQDQINRAIALLRATGSLQYGRKRMMELVEESVSVLESAFEGQERTRLLKELAEFGIRREK